MYSIVHHITELLNKKMAKKYSIKLSTHGLAVGFLYSEVLFHLI